MNIFLAFKNKSCRPACVAAVVILMTGCIVQSVVSGSASAAGFSLPKGKTPSTYTKEEREKKLAIYYYDQGALFLNKKEYKKAIQHFELADFFDPGNDRILKSLKKARIKDRRITISPDVEGTMEFAIPDARDYRIGSDDILEIVVWQHPDLSREVIVRPDGKVSFLLIGDVQAAGRTVEELDFDITKRMTAFAAAQRGGMPKPPPEAEETESEFTLSANDKVDISVWKSPDLSISTAVRPDGKISFPLIGDINAEGTTLVALDEEITRKLRKFVRDPQVLITVTEFGKKQELTYVTEFITTEISERPEVSVLVKRFGSRKVIVFGEVSSPGIYDIDGDARLLDAIAYAGDFTNFAVRENVFLVRGNINDNPTIMKFDVWDIIKKGRVDLNVPLQNQDIVYAPRNFIGSVKAFMEGLSPTITTLMDSIELREAIKATWKK